MSCPSEPIPLPGTDTSEGDGNLSPHRRRWRQCHIDAATRELLDRDQRRFLRQSLSTPCPDVLAGCRNSTLFSSRGRAYLDFHGNSAHSVGYGHPAVIEAVTRQMAERVLYTCLSRGLSFKISHGGFLALTPPLTIANDQFYKALAILEEALTKPEEP